VFASHAQDRIRNERLASRGENTGHAAPNELVADELENRTRMCVFDTARFVKKL
jgi:hypothetical protein